MKLDRESVNEEIPTSSMADIAFLLIIYFMLTTTFAATRGLDFALPDEDEQPPVIEKEESVLIEIQPGGQLMVDQEPSELQDILPYLKPKLENNPKKPVIIKPDPMSAYGHMVSVFDLLRQGRLIEDPTAPAGKRLVWDKEEHEVTDEDLEHGQSINISIPTKREIDSFWY